MQGKCKFVMDLWKVDKNKNKENARKMQICIGLMERWINTRTRKMQGKCKFVLDLWKGI